MLADAFIEEKEYQERVRDLISRILQAAFRSKDLKTFLDEIVEVGAEKTEARSCDIFLLEEPEEKKGRILRIYATSGEVGETLKEEGAWYYVPKRKLFKEEGEGKKKVIAYLRNYFREKCGYSEEELKKLEQDLEKEGKYLTDVLGKSCDIKSLMGVVNEMGDNLIDLVENGDLPMGITASVVKTKESIPPLHGNEVREHPEWRGSYEGAHEICTSLIDVPLKTREGKVLGMIKIENHKQSDSISDFSKDIDKHTIFRFTEKHKEILTILTDSVLIAIENILYRADTYKKIFGTEILRKIDELKIDNPNVNKEIHNGLKDFYSQLKIEIEDIGGIDEIYDKLTRLVTDIAQILGLHATLCIIDNIGPAFEALLGTDVRYREHFAHQFQVFLLGYYLINTNDSIQKKLIKNLQKIDSCKDCDLEDVLKVWFIASMFHDFSYSVGKIEDWLKNYFTRVAVPSKFQVNWADIYTHYEMGKTNLVELISCNSNKAKDKIAAIINDAFIKKYDHGVISALVLMNLLHNKLDDALLREACCAIALHAEAIYSKFDKLKIDQFPFAFLLVFCDNAQQWGRPRMMTLIPDIEVKLEDIITDNCKKVEIKLRFQRLTHEQRRIIETNTTPPTNYWHSEESPKFSIVLCDEKGPFRSYVFPFD